MSFGDHEVSEDFLRLYGSAFFPHWTLDAAKHRIDFRPGQVEEAARLASHLLPGNILRRVVLIMIADDLQLQGKHPAPVFEALKVIFIVVFASCGKPFYDHLMVVIQRCLFISI